MINNDSIDALEQAASLSAAASPQHMAVPDGWRLFPAAAPQVVADERAAFVAHQRRADNIPEFITDDVIMAGEITNHQWAGWQARAALAAAPVQPVAVPDGPSAEDYSDMLRDFFFRYAAGGYNDDGGLVPLAMANDKLQWIIDEEGRRAAPVQPVAVPDESDAIFQQEFKRGIKGLFAAPAAQGDAKDAERLDFIEECTVDLRCHSAVLPGCDDADVYWNVIEHHMAAPIEREIGWGNTVRQAIDAAIAAKAAS